MGIIMGKFRLLFERVVARIRGYYGKVDGYERIARVFDHFDSMLADLAEGRGELLNEIKVKAEFVDELNAEIAEAETYADKAKVVANKLAALADTEGLE
jgi:hypothetical protein